MLQHAKSTRTHIHMQNVGYAMLRQRNVVQTMKMIFSIGCLAHANEQLLSLRRCCVVSIRMNVLGQKSLSHFGNFVLTFEHN